MTQRSLLLTTWMYPLLTLGLCPLAVLLGGQLDWGAGVVSLVVLIVPTCLASLSEPRVIAIATAVIASLGCIADAGLSPAAGAGFNWGFAMLSVGIIFGVSGMIANVVEPLQSHTLFRAQPAQDFLRDLSLREQESNDLVSEQLARFPMASIAAPGEDGPAINYPLLLIALHDASRRIATHLDLDSLLPTVVSTTRQLLKCEHCELFLWNSAQGTMENALQRQPSRYLPQTDRGLTRWVLERRDIVTRADIERDLALHALCDEDPVVPDAVAPLLVADNMIGLLVVHGMEPNPAAVRVLYMLSSLAAMAIHTHQLGRRSEELNRIDVLTGLLNHANFQESLGRLTRTALHESRPLVAVMSDFDHFKIFNDTYGYEAGERALHEMARLWQRIAPPTAVLGRYGGDELICVIPDQTGQFGHDLAESVRAQLAALTLNFEGQKLHLTACFGVAELGRPSRSAAELCRSVDDAVHRAKLHGRNRVYWSPTPVVPRRAPLDPLEALSDTVVVSSLQHERN